VAGYCNTLFFYRDDRPFTPGKYLAARDFVIDPNYLTAAGVPLLHGRNFAAADGIGFDPANPRPGTILINDSMAREFYPGENPIGKRIFFDFAVQSAKLRGLPVPRYEIVGIVGDIVPSLDRAPQAALYRPLLDVGPGGATVLLYTRVAPQSVAPAALQEIHKLDGSMAVYDVGTIQEALGRSAANRRFVTLLFGVFAGLAVLLAAVGLYGVLAYAVTQRTAEIGIRMALGASGANVSRYILWEGLKPALAGIAAGLVAAFFACRVLKSLLFGIMPLDPPTFAVVPPLLLAVAAFACYLPALRATRIEPMVALRSE
jgi:putative ABC transport system permease protein